MIYTFYSFKGGVGRSMALANVAEWFRRHGLSVVMVDWDLEAPGLENFFPSALVRPDTVRARPGLMDLLLAYQRLFHRLELDAYSERLAGPLEVLSASLPPISSVLHELYPPGDGFGGLKLLGAGWRALPPSGSEPSAVSTESGPPPRVRVEPEPLGEGPERPNSSLPPATDRFADYSRAVQAFDWANFYACYHGFYYFEWLRGQLEANGEVILVDSRTGVTEMGGVCARQLADVVVAFCAPNEQNLDGTVQMVGSFERPDVVDKRGRPLVTVVVPARLDNSEIDLRNEFEQSFKTKLTMRPHVFETLGRRFWDLRVPYVAKYAYSERLAVGAVDRAEDLEEAYANLGAHLALLAPEGGLIQTRLSQEFRTRFPGLQPGVLLAWEELDGLVAAQQAAGIIRVVGISVELVAVSSRSLPTSASEVLRSARHLVLLATPEAIRAPAFRDLWLLARRSGVHVHVLRAGRPAGDAAQPVWMRRAQVYDLGGDTGLAPLLEALRSTTTPAPVPLMAPAPGEGFVGRPQALAEVKRLLLSQDQADPDEAAVGLWGAPGSGKTTLAAAVCADDDVIARFDGGILWVQLGSEADLLTEFSNLYEALMGTRLTFDGVQDAEAKLSAAFQGRKCLLVLDDVDRPEIVAPFLRVGRRLARLVIARDLELVLAVRARPVAVGALATDEGVALLQHGLELSQEAENVLARLVERLGGIPLALELARQELARRLQLGEDAIEAVGTINRLLDEQGPLALDSPSVLQSLGSVLDQVVARLGRADRERYSKLAVRASDGAISTDDLPNLLGISSVEADGLVQRLAAQSLVTLDVPSRVIRLHPLLVDYLHHQQPTEIPQSSAREEARQILAGRGASLEELEAIAERLKAEKQFTYARRLLARASGHVSFPRLDPRRRRRILQQLALCTYKDDDLPVDIRLDRALEILSVAEDVRTTRTQETLGLAGAIYKRKWEVDAQRVHLHRALEYYLRGYRAGDAAVDEWDMGYTGINAAFILDLLAHHEEREARAVGSEATTSAVRQAEARRIREKLIEDLQSLMRGPKRDQVRQNWWVLVTLAEACLGLGRYDHAREWVRRAVALSDVPDWELEATARQLTSLALLQDRNEAPTMSDTGAWRVLADLLRGDPDALRQMRLGKMGLALSGGGFRASLFHIGTLARLAEADALRHIEVISCVSGGSIIGAHYYLELRKLLQEKTDEEITANDYIEIVRRIERDFLAGVQTNIRTSVTLDPIRVVGMIVSPHWSRTHRLGDLYEARLFSRVGDGQSRQPRYLSGLYIHPKDAAANFSPKLHNWRRRAKVPVLVLNATTLNTGHNWQFTASWMGEPPSGIDADVDANDQLRRLYYEDAPPAYRRVRLGQAVAASSCVPGLFPPLALAGLYPGRTVELVDGGVHDNQGTAALLEQDCTVIFASDGSGQMQSDVQPGTAVLTVLQRSGEISGARVRTVQYRELAARRRASLLRGLVFVHLRKDLDIDPIDWIGCPEPYVTTDETRPAGRQGAITRYGVRKDVQDRLSRIRTDLDSFTDAEACALMTSAYRMTDHELKEIGFLDFAGAVERQAEWRFLAVDAEMAGTRTTYRTDRLLRILEAGSRRFFKTWELYAPLRAISFVGAGAVTAAALAGAFFGVRVASVGIPVVVTESILPTAIAIVGGLLLAGAFLLNSPTLRGAVVVLGRVGVAVPAALGLALFSLLDKFLDGFYLRAGRVGREQRTTRESAKPPGPPARIGGL